MKFDNKIAVITGAAQGIGLATAKLFVENGASVYLLDIQKEKVALEAQKLGSRAKFFHLDVREESAWKEFANYLKNKTITPDILVNNAGVSGLDKGFGEQNPLAASVESWDEVFRVNTRGVFLGCRFAIEMMSKKGGVIVNISSRAAKVGRSWAAAYAASKAAVTNLTKSVALYCAEENLNIRCNSVHPGLIQTPMWDAILGDDPEEKEQRKKYFASEAPLKRFADAKEVAQMNLFLASDASSYVTGSEFMVDGGILAGSSHFSPRKS